MASSREPSWLQTPDVYRRWMCYNSLMEDWTTYVQCLGKAARRASRKLASLDGATKSAALRQIATSIRSAAPSLLPPNAKYVDAAKPTALAPTLIERLK